ncbi:MAG: 4Fe-4S cluster-binding domain-containing protein [Oscillibacter sp.]|nr:4Fe-4S cluster-binding domain-containing protein [Oscillibacter sp.]
MICTLCPRKCGALRTAEGGKGFCGMPETPVIARAMLHQWEEPCISGTRGSGAVFFSGCVLGCVFCQNGKISRDRFGKPVTAARLREIFEELIAQGAHNINLVSPTPFVPAILEALEAPLPVPVVWNTGGYERVETLRQLEGRVQIWLPDLKYADNALAKRYSGAGDYFETAAAAILEMYRQSGDYVLEDGLLRRGVVIRHLLLPGGLANAKAVMDWVAEHFRPGQVLFSLMSQYTPQPGAEGLLSRRVTAGEYRASLAYMENLGITDGYCQDSSSAKEEYTPEFDLQGI